MNNAEDFCDSLKDLTERNSYILYSLIEFLSGQDIIHRERFVDYCNGIENGRYAKEIKRDENAARSLKDDLHPGGIKATLALCDMAGVDSSKLVLDAGTGHGGAARVVAENYCCRIIGIDCDYIRLINAIFRTKALNLDHLLSFKLDNAYQMSFEDSRFDVVLRQHSVYGGEEAVFINECRRVLKPGGVIAFNGILKAFDLGGKKNKLEDYTLKEYAELLRKAGFLVQEVETEKSTEELLASYRHGNNAKMAEMVGKKMILGFKLTARKG